MYASALPGKIKSSEIRVEINKKLKNIPDIINRSLKKD